MNMNFNSSKSAVWNFFEYNNTVKVKCNLCFSYISRGGTGKKASTSPLLNHLRNKHKEDYEKKKPFLLKMLILQLPVQIQTRKWRSNQL